MELLENPSAWWQISALVFDTSYELYLYLTQAGRGVVGWDGKALGGGGGVGTTETLCVIHLLHTHPQVAPFAKDQAAK